MTTVAVLCSGPSLTQADVDAVRVAGMPIVVTNTTYRLMQPEDHFYVYAADSRWAQYYDLSQYPRAEVYSYYPGPGTTQFRGMGGSYNSGQKAIEFAAARLGAQRVILLGCDCSLRHGVHHHPDHPHRNPTPDSVRGWHREYAALLPHLRDTVVINCSRYTELRCFQIGTLENELLLWDQARALADSSRLLEFPSSP